MTFPVGGGSYLSTGVMIGANDVLVSAHALYNPGRGGYATAITVIPAKSGASEPYGAYSAVSIQVPQAFVEGKGDIALVGSHTTTRSSRSTAPQPPRPSRSPSPSRAS